MLWDVDHTLLSVGDLSRSLYEHAFAHVTGKRLGALASLTGRTERAIVLETLRLNGIDEPDELFAQMCAALGVAARELAGRMREQGMALPGSRHAIDVLRSESVQSVVTGNILSVATVKLEAFALLDGLDLDVGGYGDQGSDRAELVRLARARAEAKYGTSFAGRRTYVIGDTTHDIKGARDATAYAIGVATGSDSVSELEDAGADLVLTDLTSARVLRDTIIGRRVS